MDGSLRGAVFYALKLKADPAKTATSYGPAECTVVCAAVGIIPGTDTTSLNQASNIGHPVACRLWVVDPRSHDVLAPIGAVGELVVQGPIVARGYLNDKAKTDESFVHSPKWLHATQNTGDMGSRIYKTGDLVQYNSDGSIRFIGRKDRQVKVRGQRVELGEIESVLAGCAGARHSMVLLPKTGQCRSKLVAVISHSLASGTDKTGDVCISKDSGTQESISDALSKMRTQLSHQLPSYMVPDVWVMVDSVPLSPSLKIDRRVVTRWIEEWKLETYSQILAQSCVQDLEAPKENETESKLQQVWAQVLNLPLGVIGTQNSFLRLGGDSISAMQVMAKARTAGILVSVRQILSSKTLVELAQCAEVVKEHRPQPQVVESSQPFGLSPIQDVYFSRLASAGSHHFHQSFFLRLQKKVAPAELHKALDKLFERHAMLRARFHSRSGTWMQSIEPQVLRAYSFNYKDVSTKAEMETFAKTTYETLDLAGPVFAADMFRCNNGVNCLFLVAHHLVIDLVSWRTILQDLEDFILHGSFLATPSTSFQQWSLMQTQHAERHLEPHVALPISVPEGNLSYWGLGDRPNRYGDTTRKGFELSTSMTSRLLGECHNALRTVPIDIFLSAIIHSFQRVFSDRDLPAVYNESHGREPWTTDVDISGTVGWFTTFSPVYVEKVNDDVLETVRMVKDIRRQIPHNGWAYFASSHLTEQGRAAFGHHDNMELMFNYAGLYQQFERTDAVFTLEEWEDNEPQEIGDKIVRPAAIEIGASVHEGKALLSFVFNRHMLHLERVETWVKECETTLCDMVNRLGQMSPEFTPSDLPVLNLGLDEIQRLNHEILPSIGSFDDISDIYPCSPMQEGILLSQMKDAGSYRTRFAWQVSTTQPDDLVDAQRLGKAWQLVEARHPTLRTTYAKSASTKRLYDQVVMKTSGSRMAYISINDNDDPLAALRSHAEDKIEDKGMQHFTICTTPQGVVFCMLDIDHGLIDGGSVGPLLSDLTAAYIGNLPEGQGPLYKDYIQHIESLPMEESMAHWKHYLRDAQPCCLPRLVDDSWADDSLVTIDVTLELSASTMLEFCATHNVTLAHVFQTAWALVLRTFTGADDILFGYLVFGRDTPVPGIEHAVGLFASLLVSRFQISDQQPIIDVVAEAQRAYLQNLDHQHCSIAQVQHALGTLGQPLFNTGISFQKLPSESEQAKSSLSFTQLGGNDSTEYDLIVNVASNSDFVGAALSFWTSKVSHPHGSHIAACFSRIVSEIVAHPAGTVSDIDPVSELDIVQISSNIPYRVPSSNMCVHELFKLQALKRPSAPAVDSWDGLLSYKEVNELSDRLCEYLLSLGVGPEIVVPVCFGKSKWAVVSMLAIMKARGTWTPIDPAYPETRRNEIAEQVHATIVLSSKEHRALWSHCNDVNVLVVDHEAFSNMPAFEPVPECREASRLHNAAYILFTSGSTGQPKGVIIENRSLTTSIVEQAKALHITSQTRTLQFTSYTFDPSLVEIFSALVSGACVCIPSDSARLGDIATVINDMKVTWASLTPTFLRTMKHETVPGLETLIVGGESLDSETLSLWRMDRELIQVYGPTEATVTCMAAPIPSSGPANPANIGRPLACRVWVVNPRDHNILVPVGSIGELLIEGSALARGYLGDNEKTQAAFIENPAWVDQYFQHYGLHEGSQARYYKTGDLVRYNFDGTVEFVSCKHVEVATHAEVASALQRV